MFKEPIGYKVASDGSKILLHYVEMKIRNRFYYIIAGTTSSE
ncbi:DUF6972 family protein [Pseudoteredinibacter isoporae]